MHPNRSRSLLSTFATLLMVAPVLAQKGVPAFDVEKARVEGRAALQSGDWTAASATFRKIVAAAPSDGTSWQLLGYSLHADGNLDEALPIHKKAAEFPEVAPVACYNAACVYALKGNTEEAFAWLGKAADAGFDRPEHIATDSDMDPLRKDPRFAAIMKKIESKAGPERVQVFAIKNERKCARVAWFGRSGSPGQIAIQDTPVTWRDKYEAMVDSADMIGKKWRLGADFWTSLDTSIDLSCGGVTVPAGYYYLTVAQQEPGRFVLGVHDANEVKKMRIDAFQADQVRGGIEIPLVHEKSDEVAENLSIGIQLEAGSQDHGEFAVAFGGHRLTAPVLMKVAPKQPKQPKK